MDKNQKTTFERTIGIILGLLLIPAIAINIIRLFLPHFVYMPVAILMVGYALFAKKRHPRLESMFFIWALLITFVLGGAFYAFRAIVILINYTPTILEPNQRLIFFALPLLSIAGGLFFLLQNIFINLCNRFKTNKVLMNLLLFLIILTFLVAPFFINYQPEIGYAKQFLMGGFSDSQLFALSPDVVKNAKLSFNDSDQQWLVEVKVENKNQKSVAIKAIYLNKNKVDLNSKELFLDNLSVDRGFLIIKPYADGTIAIKSRDPIFRILLEEDNDSIRGFDFTGVGL